MPSLPFAAWIERDVVHAAGADTVAYLQGQLAQDIAALGVGGSAWSLLLEPAGKVDAWLRVTRVGETEVVLDTDRGGGELVLARLERFKLRTDCTLEPHEAMPALAVRGVRPDPPVGLPIAWPGVPGYDLLGPSAQVPDDVTLVDAEAYEVARIASGVPATGTDLTADTIPAEAGQWLIDASVSFTKGCYTGQELVARVDSRGGNVPRPLRRLEVDSPADASLVGQEVRASGHAVGRITSAAHDPERMLAVALGPVARTVGDHDDDLEVAGHPARLVALAA